MEPIFAFGFKLSELLKKSESAGIGLLCLSIKDAGKNPQQMGYQDFKEIFQTYLPRRLEEMKVISSAQSSTISAEMLKLLSQKQSIFTMTVS